MMLRILPMLLALVLAMPLAAERPEADQGRHSR